MFYGLQQLSIGEVISSFRDLSIVGVVITVVWKARGVYETVQDFFARVMTHMDTMEQFAQVAVKNHLHHIEQDLKVLSGRKTNYSGDVVEFSEGHAVHDGLSSIIEA
jgi:hypothetical protein